MVPLAMFFLCFPHFHQWHAKGMRRVTGIHLLLCGTVPYWAGQMWAAGHARNGVVRQDCQRTEEVSEMDMRRCSKTYTLCHVLCAQFVHDALWNKKNCKLNAVLLCVHFPWILCFCCQNKHLEMCSAMNRAFTFFKPCCVSLSDSSTVWSVVRTVIRKNDALGFYQGLTTTILREIPGYFCLFVTYELSCKMMMQKFWSDLPLRLST